jgi:hypothetical protein
MAAVSRSQASSIQEIPMGSHFFHAVTLLCVGVAPQGLLAQASDPNAAVPSLVYNSVFEGTSRGVVTDQADWKKANEAVGQFGRGHVDVLKWEEQAQSGAPQREAPAQRNSGASPAVVPRP